MITCLVILASSNTMAESPSFKKAVDLFKQGYEECTEAQRIRSQDINQATEKFSKYLELKEQAAKVDASILTTNLHNISRDIEYCENAQQDILRSKAFPIMETALEACQMSKEQLAKANTVDATNSYRKYEELYQKAINVTPSITKVSSIKIKLGRCNKLKTKISEAETQLKQIKQEFDLDHKTVSSALDTCNSANKIVEGSKPSVKNISKAKDMLNDSKDKLRAITEKRNMSTNLKNYTSLRINQQINNKILSTIKCHSLASTSISKAELLHKKKEVEKARLTKEKQERERLISEKNKAEQKRKDEQEKLAKIQKMSDMKRENEEKRLAELKQKEELLIKEKEALKRKQAQEEAMKRDLAKERLKSMRQSQDWSSTLESESNSNSTNKEDDESNENSRRKKDWRSLTN